MTAATKDLTPRDAIRRLQRIDVTAKEWCERAEVSVSTWQRWQRGAHEPRASTRRVLAMALCAMERERGRDD